MPTPLSLRPHPRIRYPVAALALAVLGAASIVRAENAGPRVIETPALKLFGDGSAPSAPPPQSALTITTPALRLIGDGSSPSRETPPPPAITIETRPLKLIGGKP